MKALIGDRIAQIKLDPNQVQIVFDSGLDSAFRSVWITSARIKLPMFISARHGATAHRYFIG